MTFAGLPAQMLWGGMELATTAPAATMESWPMVTPFKISARVPIQTRSSMVTESRLGKGWPSSPTIVCISESKISTSQEMAQCMPIEMDVWQLMWVLSPMIVCSPICREAGSFGFCPTTPIPTWCPNLASRPSLIWENRLRIVRLEPANTGPWWLNWAAWRIARNQLSPDAHCCIHDECRSAERTDVGEAVIGAKVYKQGR